jgi:hypothetical protein
VTRADITIRIADVEEFRLFVWELRTLADEMRVVADPFAERLERAVDRFTDNPEERPDG